MNLKILIVIGIWGALDAILCVPSFAQRHEEKCVYGNCKNGTGILAINGNLNDKKPLPFHQVNIFQNNPSTFYYYYQLGEFKDKKLNGKGYRISSYGSFTNPQTIQRLVYLLENKKLESSIKEFQWYESGLYASGVLNGNGIQIETENGNPFPTPRRDNGSGHFEWTWL